jgi:hypothetical protein
MAVILSGPMNGVNFGAIPNSGAREGTTGIISVLLVDWVFLAWHGDKENW